MLINSAQLPHTNDSTFAVAPHPTTTRLSTQWYDCGCQKGLPTRWFLCSICSAALPMELSCRSTQLTMSVVSSATTIWRSDTHPIVFILVSSDALGRPQATLFTEVPQPMSVPESHPDGPKVGTKNISAVLPLGTNPQNGSQRVQLPPNLLQTVGESHPSRCFALWGQCHLTCKLSTQGKDLQVLQLSVQWLWGWHW